eukprot:7407281-Pyramimonas_sp.AAC.1
MIFSRPSSSKRTALVPHRIEAVNGWDILPGALGDIGAKAAHVGRARRPSGRSAHGRSAPDFVGRRDLCEV